jgi:hypothetical protein
MRSGRTCGELRGKQTDWDKADESEEYIARHPASNLRHSQSGKDWRSMGRTGESSTMCPKPRRPEALAQPSGPKRGACHDSRRKWRTFVRTPVHRQDGFAPRLLYVVWRAPKGSVGLSLYRLVSVILHWTEARTLKHSCVHSWFVGGSQRLMFRRQLPPATTPCRLTNRCCGLRSTMPLPRLPACPLSRARLGTNLPNRDRQFFRARRKVRRHVAESAV